MEFCQFVLGCFLNSFFCNEDHTKYCQIMVIMHPKKQNISHLILQMTLMLGLVRILLRESFAPNVVALPMASKSKNMAETISGIPIISFGCWRLIFMVGLILEVSCKCWHAKWLVVKVYIAPRYEPWPSSSLTLWVGPTQSTLACHSESLLNRHPAFQQCAWWPWCWFPPSSARSWSHLWMKRPDKATPTSQLYNKKLTNTKNQKERLVVKRSKEMINIYYQDN